MNSSHWWRPLLQAVLAVAVGSLTVLTAWLLVTLYQVTGEIQDTQEGNEAILEYIEDCTDPDGESRRQAEARDAAQVGAFNAVVIAAEWCGKVTDTRRELGVCVAKILEGKGHK